MRYQMARAGWNHAPQCMLTPEQVQEFVPIMNIDKVARHLFQIKAMDISTDHHLIAMLNRNIKFQ